MEREVVVQMKNVSKKIGNRTIIDQLSLQVYPGEVYGFLGPNGAGKTMTIRMIVGLISMTEGDVLIHGKSVTNNFEKAIAHVGGVIENPEMYEYLSGYENLVHFARMSPKKVTKQRISQVVKLVGLDGRIQHKVRKYSLGMKQRLGLAQAILHSPSLLILDEPTNGLDPAGIREIRAYIRNVAHQEQMAVFVSSHLLAEMQLMCDRIGIVQNGKLIREEGMNELTKADEEKTIQLQVNRLEDAFQLLNNAFPTADIEIIQDRIIISLRREYLPSCNQVLVQNNFDVYEMAQVQTTLEEKFLEVTEEK
ncbi:ABC-2 type transport system ATP-binding protein [Salsuginibacillus halophilus]|uniref:ABC-2 type transport system ATP-binding protein n=1 Tax=Salsuginibacillus halophilus TaxID=517424 RepID=A0A2P8HEA9_9BACI|nr:ABC transporter ATP-binding protein [Salsuginibacillus halophilus]PSL44560.1 ABC-2 type transport system ATP-binding protein [Salsuginibacillus halophilus]